LANQTDLGPKTLGPPALAGLDQGETSTIPALRNVELWNAFEAARAALAPQLSATRSAPRFNVAT
jgi:hypothetical protein